MASNYFRIKIGTNLQPLASSVSTQGDVSFNSSTNIIETYTTQKEQLASDLNTLTLSNKTLASAAHTGTTTFPGTSSIDGSGNLILGGTATIEGSGYGVTINNGLKVGAGTLTSNSGVIQLNGLQSAGDGAFLQLVSSGSNVGILGVVSGIVTSSTNYTSTGLWATGDLYMWSGQSTPTTANATIHFDTLGQATFQNTGTAGSIYGLTLNAVNNLTGNILAFSNAGTIAGLIGTGGSNVLGTTSDTDVVVRSQTGAIYLATNSTKALTIDATQNAIFVGTVQATSFSGSGASLTSLNASNLSSGTVPAAQMPALTGDVTTSAGSVSTSLVATSNTTLTSLANLVTVGTLTGGSTGAGFTVALSTSTITGTLADARLPTSMATKTFTGVTSYPASSSIDGSGNAVFKGPSNTLGSTADPGSAKATLTIQGSTTAYTNASGLTVNAGSSASDFTAIFANAANSANNLVIAGNGNTTVGGTFKSDNLTVSHAGDTTITINPSSGNSAQNVIYKNTAASGNYNFREANNNAVAGWELTPSTATDGSTYSHPAIAVTGTGSSATSSNIALNGAVTLGSTLTIPSGQGSTGSTTVTFAATNAPSLTTPTHPSIWMAVTIGSTVYYFPGWN